MLSVKVSTKIIRFIDFYYHLITIVIIIIITTLNWHWYNKLNFITAVMIKLIAFISKSIVVVNKMAIRLEPIK